MSVTESCPFKYGQKIICINDDFRAAAHCFDHWARPVEGNVYTVRGMFVADVIVFPYGEQVTVLLEEVRNPPVTGYVGKAFLDNVEVGFYWRRFAPLVEDREVDSEGHETNIDCFRRLITEPFVETEETVL